MLRYLQDENDCLLDRIRLYSEETGTPLAQCIHEAISEWLECVAEPKLDVFRARQSKLKSISRVK